MTTTTEMPTPIETFRMEVRNWLEANCPTSMRQPIKSEKDLYWGGRNGTFANEDQKAWFEAMYEKGWIVPHWPKEYGGGGLGKEENKIVLQEMARLGCRKPITSFGIWMLGPALLKFGSEEQKRHYLPEITAGKIRWCQGYSEPNAGSDLASLATSAVDMGDHYVVNGQKVWTSYADNADWIFCLVRTNKEAKHGGISFLLIDMATEGVSTSPIKLISGKSPFCETFFDNVKVPKENLVGELNRGWTIAKYLLTHEREMIGGIGETDVKKPLHQVAIESLGTENGTLNDPILRPDIARWSIDKMAYDITIKRTMDEVKAGQSLGAASSFFKYYGTELNKAKYELMLAMGGYDGAVWEGEEFNEGQLARQFCRTKGNSIEGGTSEVQLNIVAKRILGLPSK
ncbi:MAG: acyl-CoA dehydrogenase family protein [Saprospiraceae bacterium]|nr:acyl-CoA dehydrogenase family protein [Saprospiraceae bacterium]